MWRKRVILKNLLSLAFAHFLVFTAFDSLSNLQSTVNKESGVGTASQSVIFAFFTLSSFFLPTFLIKRFGCKRTLLLSVFGICPYIAANLYPSWGTLIPSAVLCGLAFGPLWAARSTYVNEISYQYCTHTTLSISVVNAWFFGIYSFFHENAEIWGNVMSYLILKENHHNGTERPVSNEVLYHCGADFCGEDPEVFNPNLQPPSIEKWYTLTSLYLCLVVAAGFVIWVTTDPLEQEVEKAKDAPSSGLSADILIATLKHMKNKNQMLLIPLSFYVGLADGFYNTDYTKSYIACGWGVSQVGFVTICYGVVSAVMDCSSGFLVKYLTRMPVFLVAAASHFAMFLTLLLQTPQDENFSLFFALSGIFGVGSSVWWAQITAFYGVIFKEDEEAAFSNFYFWSSLGCSVAYAYSDSICTGTKLYILLILLFISILLYAIVELRLICTSAKRVVSEYEPK